MGNNVEQKGSNRLPSADRHILGVMGQEWEERENDIPAPGKEDNSCRIADWKSH